MTSPTAGSDTPPDPAQPQPGVATTDAKPAVTIRFDHPSILRAGITIFILTGVFLLALWLYTMISHFLFLLLLAWLFAAALEPGIRAIIRRGRSRGFGAAVMIVGAVLTALILAAILGQLFFSQITEFVQAIPALTTSIIDWVNTHFHTSFNASTLTSSLNLTPSQVASWAESLSGGVFGVIGSLSAVLFDSVTVLVFGSYFAANGPGFFRTVASWLPPRGQQVFLNVSEITIEKTGGYVISKVILAGLSALFHGILFFAIGVPYWLPFALFVGITAQFVPIVGTYIGIALPVLATVFIDPWKAIVIILFAAVYQQIETYIFTPRVSKKTMDVNAAIALAAVFIGAAIWGPLGALIGIPMAAAGVAITDTYRHRYELVPEIIAGHDGGPAPEAG